ncbi:DUF6193 family natural product biosynthesis protein [Streptomyces katrae]|uniref:DUF6193 family natural product biosynthesis protein n=1 Tax=Streptomyces katrae TaxID=68223 RepID=UPI00131BF1C9|nr:DUF6193 family natural product biosynthesis protein [Streptomyces katrae]
MNLHAADTDTAHRVDARWQRLPTTWRLIQERGGPETLCRGVIDLIEAAAAQPQLRRLYPFTRQWTLWFSSRARHPFEVEAPAVEPTPDGRFRVRSPSLNTVIAEADTAEAAIALVVEGLSAGGAAAR